MTEAAIVKEEAAPKPETAVHKQRKLVRKLISRRPHLLPAAFHEHSRAARKETLLAIRSVLDARIERLDRAPEKEPEAKKAHRVKVE